MPPFLGHTGQGGPLQLARNGFPHLSCIDRCVPSATLMRHRSHYRFDVSRTAWPSSHLLPVGCEWTSRCADQQYIPHMTRNLRVAASAVHRQARTSGNPGDVAYYSGGSVNVGCALSDHRFTEVAAAACREAAAQFRLGLSGQHHCALRVRRLSVARCPPQPPLSSLHFHLLDSSIPLGLLLKNSHSCPRRFTLAFAHTRMAAVLCCAVSGVHSSHDVWLPVLLLCNDSRVPCVELPASDVIHLCQWCSALCLYLQLLSCLMRAASCCNSDPLTLFSPVRSLMSDSTTIGTAALLAC